MSVKTHKDLDMGYAWIVASANCWVNFSIYGLFRSYGVLYVAFMEVYGVNHQMASWPFTLCCAVYHLIGPLVGLLSTRYSLRRLQTIGCLIAAFGVLLAYFATDFIMVIICIGAIQGLGLGVIRTLSNVVIQEYFVKHRATATGIAMAGGTISSFFFPPFAEYVLENFGLRLSCLIFGLVMLQAVIGIVLQRAPHYLTDEAPVDSCQQTAAIDKKMLVEQEEKGLKGVRDQRESDDGGHQESHAFGPIHADRCDANLNQLKLCDNCVYPINAYQSLLSFNIDNNESDDSLLESSSSTESQCRDCYPGPCQGHQDVADMLDTESAVYTFSDNNEIESGLKVKKDSIGGNPSTPSFGDSDAIQSLLIVLSEPMFFVICFMFVTYNVCLQVYLMTIVDIAIKNKIAGKADAILLISVFSVADLIGRVSFGWISDKGYVKPKNIAIVCHALLAIALIFTPIVRTLFALRICAFIVGLLIGIITILWPILNVDYFGTERLAISLGLNCFFSGAESLVRPFLIGYYLDYLNRYDLLFYTIAGVVLLTMILWLLEPLISRRSRRR